MNAVTIDTLKVTKTLQAAGMPITQAEAVATTMRDSTEGADLVTNKDLEIRLQKELAPIKTGMHDLQTELAPIKAGVHDLQTELAPIKAGLHELQTADLVTRKDLQIELQKLEAKLEPRFARLEADTALLKWMVGVIVAGVIALVIKAFVPT